MTLFKQRVGIGSAVAGLLTLLLIAGCRDVSIVTDPETTPASNYPLFISGLMSEQGQSIRVSRAGLPVTNALVTVNGFPIPHSVGDLYSGNLPEAIRPGDALKLKVVVGAFTFEPPGAIAPAPVITAPSVGSTFASTDSIRLVWASSADPDRFQVCLNCWVNSLDGATYHTSPNRREFTISPGDLVDYGTGSLVAVIAYKEVFLKATNSPQVASSVRFVSRSEAIINIKY